MKNPYQLLGIRQDATNAEIMRAFQMAMRNPRLLHDAAVARSQLSKADSRLAADFMLPIFPNTSIVEEINQTAHSKTIDLDSIDADKFNSL